MDEQMRHQFEAWLAKNPDARFWNTTDAMLAAFIGGAALPAAQGDSSHPAGGECGGVQVPTVAHEGWIEWNGGDDRQVKRLDRIDIKTASGAILVGMVARFCDWRIFGDADDIREYRKATL